MDKLFHANDMHQIDTNDIKAATKNFMAELNIKTGSNGDDVEFYELLQAYITKPNCRKEINIIASNHLFNFKKEA